MAPRKFRNIRLTLKMIKWEHSIFALPFALTGAVIAAEGWPTPAVLFWIIVCMVAARSAAMAFNRLVDAKIDGTNPRTAKRAIPAGQLTKIYVGWFIAGSSALFMFGAWRLNPLSVKVPLSLKLSPIALAIIFFYSYTKRFTFLSHIVLGIALAISPIAAWIAVRGYFDARMLWLSAVVICWVSGFDILYSCQDYEFDRRAKLHSIPQAVGPTKAFFIARTLHVLMLGLVLGFAHAFQLGDIAMVGFLLVTLLLAYEHSIIHPHDLTRMNAAFFNVNGAISVAFFLSVALDVFFRGALNK